MANATDAVAEIKGALGSDATLAALNRPANPPDNLILPAMVVFAAAGGMRPATLDGRWDGVHTIRVEIHVPREAPSLEAAYASLMGYLPLVRRQLIDGYAANRFGGTCILVGGAGGVRANVSYPLRYAIEQDEWNLVKTLALNYELDVLIEEN